MSATAASAEASTDTESPYDVIILGSGIAGLHVALQLLKRKGSRRLRLAILEKYKTLGGRISTFSEDIGGKHLQWESGAGRISKRHELLMSYMRHYGLTFVPIGTEIQYKRDEAAAMVPDTFEAGLPAFLDTLAGLPEEDLATHTIRQLLTKVHGAKKTDDYLLQFPYRAEVDVMRADMALESFKGEMGTQEGYGICGEGLSALTEAMKADIEKRSGRNGGTSSPFKMNHELVGVSGAAGAPLLHLSVRVGSPKEGLGRPVITLATKHLVLAVEADALRELNPLSTWRGLKHLQMCPLVRVYATFPLPKGGDKLWYEDLGGGKAGRLVTAHPIRYMIPANPAIGSAQISYTDSQDAEYWMKKLKEDGEFAVGKEIVEELRKLVKPDIPSPEVVKVHAWKHGATYWLPGHYSPKEMSREALRPLPESHPNLYLCGESYSLRQAWIEGALEHAEQLLGLLERRL